MVEGAALHVGESAHVEVNTYGQYNERYNDYRQIVPPNPFKTPQDLNNFHLRSPVHNFTKRQQLFDTLNEAMAQDNQPTVLTACHGLGGVGKTQLAAYYCQQMRQEYAFIAWFDAKDENRLNTQFRELAVNAGLITSEENPSNQDVQARVKQWLSKYSESSWLIVLDDAPDNNTINDFIPAGKGKVLVTSRSKHWLHVNVVPVKVMEKEEAIRLIQTMTQHQHDNETEAIATLAETLGYLPLALAQAAAYIQRRNITVADYLKRYEIRRKELLKDDSLTKYVATEHGPVGVTWLISIEALREKNKHAETLLQFCAFFDNKAIPFALLKACLKETQPDLIENAMDDLFEACLEAIQQYSLLEVDSQNKTVSMHNLVQVFIQDLLSEERRQAIILKVIKGIDKEYPGKAPTMEDVKRRRQLMPHMQSVKQHSDNVFAELEDILRGALQLSLLLNLADICSDLSDAKEQKALLERALKIQETHYGKNHWEMAITLVNLATATGDLGDAATKKALCERALAIFETYYGKTHWRVASTLVNLANATGALGDTATQKMMLERALMIQEAHYGKAHYEVVITVGNLANVYAVLGDAATQKAMLQHVLAIQEAYYGKDHWQVAGTLVNLAAAHGDLGDAATKKVLCERALAIEEAHYGKAHWQVAITLGNLAAAYGALGDADKQKTLCERALAIKEAHYGKTHWRVASTLVNLAAAYGDLGDAATQKAMLECALMIQEAHYGKAHWQVASTLDNLANVYGDLGDAVTQKTLCERALAIQEAHYGKAHLQVAITLSNLANAYRGLGDVATQKILLERALAIFKAYHGKEHVEVGMILHDLAMAYFQTQNYCRAFQTSQQAKQILQSVKDLGENHPWAKTAVKRDDRLEQLILPISQQNDFSLANYALQQGDIEKAIQHYEQHIISNPDEVGDAYHNLACCYHRKGNLLKADKTFQKAIKAKPHSGIYCKYAHLLYAQKRYLDALFQLFEASKWHDNSSLWYGQSEKPFIETALQDEITRYGKIKIKTELLTWYLLIRCCKELSVVFNDYSILAQFFKEGAVPILLQKLNDLVTIMNTPQAYRLLSYTYRYLGKHESANRYLQKARAMRNEKNPVKKTPRTIDVISLLPNTQDKTKIRSTQESASIAKRSPTSTKEQSLSDETPISSDTLSLPLQQQQYSCQALTDETRYPFHTHQRMKRKQRLVVNEEKDIVLQLTEWLSLIEFEESKYKNQRNFYGTKPHLIHYQEGDCLFASIAAFVSNETATSLRKMATQHIEQDKELKSRIIALINSETPETLRTKDGDKLIKSFRQYIMLMQTEETQGTPIEIVGLARSLQRPIVILTPNNQYDYIVEEEAYRNNQPIFLNYVAEIHYAPLSVPENKNAMDILNEIRAAIEKENNECEHILQQGSSSTMAL